MILPIPSLENQKNQANLLKTKLTLSLELEEAENENLQDKIIHTRIHFSEYI